MMQYFKHQKLVVLLVVLLLVGGMSVPQVAQAQGWGAWFAGLLGFGPGDITSALSGVAGDILAALGSYVVKGINLVLYYISLLFGAVVAIEAWFITIVLTLSFNIVETPTVARGFDATLSIVNLGFVLGLIVIAIATILRWEGYGMKKTLRNFVIAALLVNFSLVIAGSVIKFGDNLALYLLQSGFGDANATVGETTGVIGNFSSAIMRAFAPQQYFNPQEGGGSIPGGGSVNDVPSEEPNVPECGGPPLLPCEEDDLFPIPESEPTETPTEEPAPTPAVAQGGSSAGVMVTMVGFFMTLLGLLLTVVTLGALIAMLLIRYVYLIGLLIVMPFAWLLWIFPSTSHYFTDWWRKFINQVFFAPIALFGVWLVVVFGVSINTGSGTGSEAPFLASTAGNAWGGAFVAWGGNAFFNVLQSVANGVVLNALMLGSLKVAQSMGQQSANIGLKWAEGAKNAYVGYVGNRSRRVANRYALETRPVQGAVRGLQNVSASQNPFLRNLGISWAAGNLGRGAQRVVESNKEAVMKDARESSKNLSTDHKINNFHAATFPQKLVWLEDIKKEGRLDEIKNVADVLSEDNKASFERYDQGKLLGEARDESGVTLNKLQGELEAIKTSDFQDEGKRYEALEKKMEEIGRHMSGLKDPHKLVQKYFTKGEFDLSAAERAEYEKAGKKIPKAPVGIQDKHQLDETRQVMLKAMAQNMSSRVFTRTMKEILLKDEEDLIRQTGKDLVNKERDLTIPTDYEGYRYTENNVTAGLRNYFATTGAKELDIGYHTIGFARRDAGGVQNPANTQNQEGGQQGNQQAGAQQANTQQQQGQAQQPEPQIQVVGGSPGSGPRPGSRQSWDAQGARINPNNNNAGNTSTS